MRTKWEHELLESVNEETDNGIEKAFMGYWTKERTLRSKLMAALSKQRGAIFNFQGRTYVLENMAIEGDDIILTSRVLDSRTTTKISLRNIREDWRRQ